MKKNREKLIKPVDSTKRMKNKTESKTILKNIKNVLFVDGCSSILDLPLQNNGVYDGLLFIIYILSMKSILKKKKKYF
jgi:hypothetical protein